MEGCETTPPLSVDPEAVQNETRNASQGNLESSESFQKFIYELFEKNGILNDLRAYLRGHIVNVLKSAQTGDIPVCQKHFTQRLGLASQALNMLIAEYLLRLEFSYTLSVFISELPLANMVFHFAKSLLQHCDDRTALRFRENDVWSVLNYLGIKCDSEHASNIIDMYKSDDTSPLLLCILQCMPMYKEAVVGDEQANSSEESLSSGSRSTATLGDKPKSHRCRHIASCKTCRDRISRLREKYKKKKKTLAKMFLQLKAVYEAEVEMVKAEQETKMKRSLAGHALQLKRRRDEMEEAFKTREAELEQSLQGKKQFLWGLARALRDQHAQMSRAMHAVRCETERLAAKEDSLKTQLADAENVLRHRGEEMRSQISDELVVLEAHLESMKRERDSIHRERVELEQLRHLCERDSKIIKPHDENNDRPYELLKTELSVLKKYLDTTRLEPKCVIEQSTITELHDVSSKISAVLNNEHDDERRDDDRGVRTPNQVINDLKKQKNVNFSQCNLDELYRERSRERSRSSASSEAGDAGPACALQRLHDENQRLKAFARQQRTHIDALSSEHARLRAELAARPPHSALLAGWRPRTAPTRQSYSGLVSTDSLNPTASANTLGWRKGAGEELSAFPYTPRIYVPGDEVPFIGVLQDRHRDSRRHLINQWRALRRRSSPPVGVGKLRTARERSKERPSFAGPSASVPPEIPIQSAVESDKQFENLFQSPWSTDRPKPPEPLNTNKNREKSPKSVLREAKEKLKSKDTAKEHHPKTREKSPNSVLREAKLRLRKLEIEAEAVERSYMDFRKRQSALRGGNYSLASENHVSKDTGDLELKRSSSLQKLDQNKAETSQHYKDSSNIKSDFNKYLCDYQTHFDISEKHFKNKTTVDASKPIPKPYCCKQSPEKDRLINFIETPLMEFRKLYHSPKPLKPFKITDSKEDPPETLKSTTPVSLKPPATVTEIDIDIDTAETDSEAVKMKCKKQAELEILKQNITKMYNLEAPANPEPQIEVANIEEKPIAPENISDINLLRVEVENVNQISEIKTKSVSQDVLLVVQSAVDANVVHSESDGDARHSANMTILISPKRSRFQAGDDIDFDRDRSLSPDKRRSMSPEQAARLTRNDVLDAIFHTDMIEVSSSDMHLADKDESLSEVDKDAQDYPDDFSADVDNYNSHSEYDNNSPISLPKTSEDDNFWES